MKIYLNRIPPEGTMQEDVIDSQALDLEAGIMKFEGMLKVKAKLFKITNVLTVDLLVEGLAVPICGRCLEQFESPVEKSFQLVYDIQRPDQVIDLDPDIREEIILGYPIQSFCSDKCKGLCQQCGKNLNQGACSCALKEK